MAYADCFVCGMEIDEPKHTALVTFSFPPAPITEHGGEYKLCYNCSDVAEHKIHGMKSEIQQRDTEENYKLINWKGFGWIYVRTDRLHEYEQVKPLNKPKQKRRTTTTTKK